jgi:SfnB family sulfur acquisition oxidoreductase
MVAKHKTPIHRLATIEPPPRLTDAPAALAAAERLAADWAGKAGRRDAERILPFAEIEAFTASGLGSITVPRAYGGPALGYETLTQVFEILCAADSSVGQIPQNQFGVLQLLAEAGTEAQKTRFFTDVLNGARIGNAGPEKGRQPMTQNKTALRHGAQGISLNGERFYSTGAIFADWIPTRANDAEGRAVQIWVPREAPGVDVIDDWSSFGQRTTASGTVIFDDVLIDSEEQILPVWRHAERPGLAGPVSQLIQAAIDSGIARGAFAETLDFIRDKSRPWVDSGVARAQDDPYIIADVGRLQIELHAAQEVLREAAQTIDALSRAQAQGTILTPDDSARASVAVAEAKILTTEAALNASEKLFELAGSAAVRAGPNLGRYWRNARVHTLHDPVRWKYHLLGKWHLNGARPNRHQWN